MLDEVLRQGCLEASLSLVSMVESAKPGLVRIFAALDSSPHFTSLIAAFFLNRSESLLDGLCEQEL